MGQESIFTTESVEPTQRDSVFASTPDAAHRDPEREGGRDVNPLLDQHAPFDRRFDAATTALGLAPSTLDFERPTVTRMRIESAAGEATGETEAVVEAAREFLVGVVAEPSAYPLER
ncbi:hypothetical protein [Haloarchaeobius sp. FL176]|uniref:hypothetical protein n=1 Tax=Haloarchaeobius sp. FL176 TaxID=2967129 RepID=UPI0021472C07|nr:hypothetical protein [Haloarchaeobius sp. FL176]